MKLFAIYIGGEHPSAHIEIHDVRFIVAASIRDTYDQLRAQWWGTPGTLHIDCWTEVTHVDGYDVALRREPPVGDKKLYFVNLGGYDTHEFSEQHKNMFVVAQSIAAAKAQALSTVSYWKDAHRDDLYRAEHVFELGAMTDSRFHIHLTQCEQRSPLRFTCRYKPLK